MAADLSAQLPLHITGTAGTMIVAAGVIAAIHRHGRVIEGGAVSFAIATGFYYCITAVVHGFLKASSLHHYAGFGKAS